MKTTIAELIKQMEEATSFINETRVMVREIHGDVMGAIRPIVEATGLECRSCWDITIPDGYGRYQTILRYTTDLTEDKRYKNDRVGKLHKLVFFPAQDYISLEDTVEEAINKVNYNNVKANHERLQNELANLYKEIEKYKGYIAETEKEMLDLASKVKINN